MEGDEEAGKRGKFVSGWSGVTGAKTTWILRTSIDYRRVKEKKKTSRTGVCLESREMKSSVETR